MFGVYTQHLATPWIRIVISFAAWRNAFLDYGSALITAAWLADFRRDGHRRCPPDPVRGANTGSMNSKSTRHLDAKCLRYRLYDFRAIPFMGSAYFIEHPAIGIHQNG